MQALPITQEANPSLIEGTPGKVSIFRWAGSKKKLINELNLAAPNKYNNYIEPFVGSGIFYLHQNAHSAVLADYNEHLIQAYTQVRDNPTKLWERCCSISNMESTYYEVRSLDPYNLNDIDRAARFIYINRYCFNGVYRTNLKGGFNVSRGKGNLGIPSWEVFKAFSDKLQGCQLQCSDFETVIDEANADDFIYIDPPYIDLSKRDRGEYGAGSFGHHDLERLAESAKRASDRGCKLLISYMDCDFMKDLFSEWRLFPLEVSRSVSCTTSNRKKAKEIFLANYM
mgnify:CR=1 FL=1